MVSFIRLLIVTLSAAVLLAACHKSVPAKPAPKQDGAQTSALRDQIMVDPDLANQNRANSAIAVGPRDGALPPEMRSADAIERARADAIQLVGGAGSMKKAPAAIEVADKLPADATLTAAARAAAAPGGNAACAQKVQYTALWAAKLPDAFPVYPRGAVQEAAGTDDGGCALRVINFVTPVTLDNVMDFYFTRASNAGFSAQRAHQQGDDVLGGTKGRASFVVYARGIPAGGTEVDLITTGG